MERREDKNTKRNHKKSGVACGATLGTGWIRNASAGYASLRRTSSRCVCGELRRRQIPSLSEMG